MMATREQIVCGIREYSKVNLLPNMRAGGAKTIVTLAINAFKRKPELFTEKFGKLDFLCENGKYDVEALRDIIQDTISDTGSFIITIPSILGASEACTISLGPEDIESIYRRVLAQPEEIPCENLCENSVG